MSQISEILPIYEKDVASPPPQTNLLDGWDVIKIPNKNPITAEFQQPVNTKEQLIHNAYHNSPITHIAGKQLGQRFCSPDFHDSQVAGPSHLEVSPVVRYVQEESDKTIVDKVLAMVSPEFNQAYADNNLLMWDRDSTVPTMPESPEVDRRLPPANSPPVSMPTIPTTYAHTNTTQQGSSNSILALFREIASKQPRNSSLSGWISRLLKSPMED
ncbi:hypothetical protein Zmor_011585 [Zophobas morio]|uniref:Uncharacterized protein n=1 Tax=Zophobas morio TaxID=2755281 RepID=A0AA38IL18_9CUCU|nr:hypothetical protein Zmor_011585 [Zophobas morio]